MGNEAKARPKNRDASLYDLTPTERRICDVLGDRLPHSAEELKACLDDELAGPTAVPFHISQLRDKLQEHGLDIANVRSRTTNSYLLVG